MNRGRQCDAEFCFEDLFDDDDEDNVNEANASGPSYASAENTPTADAEKGVSALTLTFKKLQMEENKQPNPADDWRRDVELKWSSIHTHADIPTRLVADCNQEMHVWRHVMIQGSSAPVRIPQRSLTWSAHNTDRLQQINEDGDVELQRATTFVPPHLTVEQPAIQFSLNSGLAEKRAMLKAREKILSMDGISLAHLKDVTVECV